MPKPVASASPPSPPSSSPAPKSDLASDVKKMLALLPMDLATAPWPSPAQYSEFYAMREKVAKAIG